MTERGILFSAPMVRALLEDRKTQTRRPMKPQPWKNSVGQWLWGKNHIAFWPEISNYGPLPSMCPCGKVGDRIWVRETFRTADGGTIYYRSDHPHDEGPWTPSIHMPRRASRITLEITDVRVQRVQNISGDDCVAEGIVVTDAMRHNEGRYEWGEFGRQWESIYGLGSWERNDWVWALTFKVVKA